MQKRNLKGYVPSGSGKIVGCFYLLLSFLAVCVCVSIFSNNKYELLLKKEIRSM